MKLIMVRIEVYKKVRKLLIVLSIILILFSATGIPAYAEKVQRTNTDVLTVSEAFDKAIEDVIGSRKAKGAVAALIINGDVVLSKGYGYADEFSNVKAKHDVTGFRIGSISKTFVALAALIAMEDGKLDMNTDISAYLEKNFAKLEYPVTMQHLLTHNAGFEEEITGMAVKNVSDTEPLSISVRKYMPEQIFKPGEIASYSNYAIALAAYVIQSVTGEDFADYCMNKIFLPLGMKRTTFTHMQDTVYVSKAYLPNGQETLEPYINLYPEGSAVSTAQDMAKYIEWLLGEDDIILSKKNKEELFKRQYSMVEEFEGIGYVWNRKTRNGSVYYDKKGETLNFYSRIALYPDQKAGLFLSFNTYVPDTEINAITAKVTSLLHGEKESPLSLAGATIEIEGSYVNAWSSFRSAEKLLRFFIPGKMVEISSSPLKGYSFNGEGITHIGNNIYASPIGTVKFVEKNGKTLMATDFSQTYTRINPLENKGINLTSILLFIICTFINTIQAFRLAKRSKGSTLLSGIISIVQMVSFIILGLIIFIGVAQYSLLKYNLFITVTAWIIVSAAVVNLIFTLTKSFKNGKRPFKYEYLHNIISIVFCFILFGLNLLL
jgi:CubicO group peptidase (beta-lactamase class C family)